MIEVIEVIEVIEPVAQLRDRAVQVGDGVLQHREFGRQQVGDALLDARVDLVA
jgi:hypothetical protein